jgi:heme/copper-type cytochrome/quinol oxidase subunit 2
MTHHRPTTIMATVIMMMVASGVGLFAQENAPATAAGDAIQEFNPPVITVKQGQQVKLVITATDRDHGFKLTEYNIEQKLKKGVATPVEFTADKAGTFPFECSEYCGFGHGHMKGKLVVEPAAGAASP